MPKCPGMTNQPYKCLGEDLLIEASFATLANDTGEDMKYPVGTHLLASMLAQDTSSLTMFCTGGSCSSRPHHCPLLPIL
jgi:hypothetical protein